MMADKTSHSSVGNKYRRSNRLSITAGSLMTFATFPIPNLNVTVNDNIIRYLFRVIKNLTMLIFNIEMILNSLTVIPEIFNFTPHFIFQFI